MLRHASNLSRLGLALEKLEEGHNKHACSAAISLPWYEPKRTVVCNQSSHYAKNLKVHAALQSVFLDTNLNGRWYAISLQTMLKP